MVGGQNAIFHDGFTPLHEMVAGEGLGREGDGVVGEIGAGPGVAGEAGGGFVQVQIVDAHEAGGRVAHGEGQVLGRVELEEALEMSPDGGGALFAVGADAVAFGRPVGRLSPAPDVFVHFGGDGGDHFGPAAGDVGARISGVEVVGEAHDEILAEFTICQKLAEHDGGVRLVQVAAIGGGGVGEGVVLGELVVAGHVEEGETEAEIGVIQHVAPAGVQIGRRAFGAVGGRRAPDAGIVAGPVGVAEEDIRLVEVHETVEVKAVGHGGVVGGVGQVVGLDEVPQVGKITAEVRVAVVVHGHVGEGGCAVNFHLHVFGFVEAVVVLVIIVIKALAQVVDAPVFAIEEHQHRAAVLALHVCIFREGLQEEVANDAVAPIVAAIAQDEGAKFVKRLVGKDLVFKRAAAARVDSDGFAGTIAGGVAVEAQTDRAAERESAVRLEKFDGAGAFPGAARLPHVVVDRGVDADVVIKQIGLAGANGDDGEREAVGAGRIHDIGVADGWAGHGSVAEGACADHAEFENFAVGWLPALVIRRARVLIIGGNIRKVVGDAGAIGQD